MNYTIFAPITPCHTLGGRGGVALIRISGPKALEALSRFGINKSLKPRQASLLPLIDPLSNEILDYSLVTFFKAPHSFTGEDVAELSIHASPYIAQRISEILSQIPGIRLAEAGEFSKTAFLNGKMDLTQAESIADLIEAETKEQHKQALKQMQGALSRLYEGWRQELIEISAHLEAYLDFPDEDLPADIVFSLEKRIEDLITQIKQHLQDNKIGEKIRRGLSLVIIGPPNVGKSSLINYLAKEQIAIVSDLPGTTRDVIETHLSIAGFPVIISDTAGLRKTRNLIEKEGIKRALQKSENADLQLLLLDLEHINKFAFKDLIGHNTLVVINKIDLGAATLPPDLIAHKPVLISLKAKINLNLLIEALENNIRSLIPTHSHNSFITRARYRESLNDTLSHLNDFSLNNQPELAAEDLRMALRSLGKITGKVATDEILDVIFAGFCIGK